MRLRVIDLDGSVARQAPLRRRIEAGDAPRIDAADLSPRLRLVATRAAMAALSGRLCDSAEAGEEASVTFYGSGDFHHVTAGLLAGVRRDVTVIHFDNHPDWVRFPPTVNCGAWVNRALELPQVKRVVTIGPCSTDLVRPELQFANLPALMDGRLLLYPWRHEPSWVWGRYGDGASHRQVGGHLHWRNLADERWSDFLDELTTRIATRAIWLTIDKDVLGPDEALTNWDQGGMPLDRVIEAVERLALQSEIVGIDVCGDYSPPVFSDPFRAVLGYFDRPAVAPPTSESLEVNELANERLLSCFERVLQ